MKKSKSINAIFYFRNRTIQFHITAMNPCYRSVFVFEEIQRVRFPGLVFIESKNEANRKGFSIFAFCGKEDRKERFDLDTPVFDLFAPHSQGDGSFCIDPWALNKFDKGEVSAAELFFGTDNHEIYPDKDGVRRYHCDVDRFDHPHTLREKLAALYGGLKKIEYDPPGYIDL